MVPLAFKFFGEEEVRRPLLVHRFYWMIAFVQLRFNLEFEFLTTIQNHYLHLSQLFDCFLSLYLVFECFIPFIPLYPFLIYQFLTAFWPHLIFCVCFSKLIE